MGKSKGPRKYEAELEFFTVSGEKHPYTIQFENYFDIKNPDLSAYAADAFFELTTIRISANVFINTRSVSSVKVEAIREIT